MYKSCIEQNDEYIYYNINIANTINPIPGSNNPSIPINFTETRTIPILDKPDDYLMSVIRFSLPGFNIPLFLFPVIPNPDDPLDINFSSLIVVMSYNGIDSDPINLRYVPQPALVPLAPLPSVAFTGKAYQYYSVYNYQAMLDIYNRAIDQAFVNLNVKITLPSGSVPPYLQFENLNGRVSLVAQRAFYDQSFVSHPITLSYNFLSERFFIGFNVLNLGYQNRSPIGKDYTFVVENTFNNFYTPSYLAPATPPDYLIMSQEFDSLSYWNDLVSVVFLSGMIPVKKEGIPSLNNDSGSVQGNAGSRPIITDFIPGVGEIAGDIASKYIYNPTSEYRMLNLTSQTPLTDIDIKVQWQDANNNLYDVFLFPGQVCTIKILFQKKSSRFHVK